MYKFASFLRAHCILPIAVLAVVAAAPDQASAQRFEEVATEITNSPIEVTAQAPRAKPVFNSEGKVLGVEVNSKLNVIIRRADRDIGDKRGFDVVSKGKLVGVNLTDSELLGGTAAGTSMPIQRISEESFALRSTSDRTSLLLAAVNSPIQTKIDVDECPAITCSPVDPLHRYLYLPFYDLPWVNGVDLTTQSSFYFQRFFTYRDLPNSVACPAIGSECNNNCAANSTVMLAACVGQSAIVGAGDPVAIAIGAGLCSINSAAAQNSCANQCTRGQASCMAW
jgi:hypothetical protein